MSSTRRTALIFGVLFLATFVFSIGGVILYDAVVNPADFIAGTGGDTRVRFSSTSGRARSRPGGRERWSARSFGTVCHGVGRQLSRSAARKRVSGGELRRQFEQGGIVVRSASSRGLAEEAPFAYKDVERVVRVVERAGLVAP